jgi:outer membrane protein
MQTLSVCLAQLRFLAAMASVVAARPMAAAAAEATPADPARPISAATTLTLTQAEESALRHQPTLRQSRGQTEAAEGRVEQARSGYLPQVSGTASYVRKTFNQVPGASPNVTPSQGFTAPTINMFNFGLTATQLIYDFGQTDGRWRAFSVSADAARANERSTEQQVLLTVRRAYFVARAQRDLVHVADSTVSNEEKHLAQIQAFVRAGIRPEIDLAQVRTDLANAKVQLVNATNNYDVALAQLNQAMGVAASVRYEPADTTLPPVPGEDGPTDTLIDQALQARPEVASLVLQRRAQELLVRSLKGGYGPALNATASTTEGGTEIDHLVPNYSIGLLLTWPLLQGGLTHGQVREAKGTLENLAGQEDSARLGVRVDVEQSQLGVRAAKASIVAADEALANAGDQLRLAEARYSTGIGSVIELGDAQVAFSNASAQEVQARYNLSSARASLLTSLGAR